MLAFCFRFCYIKQVASEAAGYKHLWFVGQAAKTSPSHGEGVGSIPAGVTKRNKSELFRRSKLVRICFLLSAWQGAHRAVRSIYYWFNASRLFKAITLDIYYLISAKSNGSFSYSPADVLKFSFNTLSNSSDLLAYSRFI